MKEAVQIAEGNTATIYLQNDRVIKVFKEHLPSSEAVTEADKQKHAHACGLPVPKIYDVTKVNGKQAIVMAYIKGKTLGDLALENMEKAEDYMKLSIDIQCGIHDITTDSLEPMNEKLKRQIQSASLLEDRQKLALLRKLDRMNVENKLCHGDYHLFNLIQSDNDVTVIDWVDSSAGDPRADVYRTYLLYAGVSMEWAERYVKLACDRSGFSLDEVFQWAPIIAGARLSENVATENHERLKEIVERYVTS
ncbi:phosphotransferase family protein [Alkalihalobacillus sp. CinArs1]|uniref:phosphotransferase family protein n=1 Tax=Alkalihalobacillus sp. CinArs1 TaxID=2995314 RepID=UPI0022DDE9E4|nr:aminoglycoside phosphotransferase family protein [Alkalihalobacillus sp. CinArs1]